MAQGINPPVLTGCGRGDCPSRLFPLLGGIRRTVCSCLCRGRNQELIKTKTKTKPTYPNRTRRLPPLVVSYWTSRNLEFILAVGGRRTPKGPDCLNMMWLAQRAEKASHPALESWVCFFKCGSSHQALGKGLATSGLL